MAFKFECGKGIWAMMGSWLQRDSIDRTAAYYKATLSSWSYHVLDPFNTWGRRTDDYDMRRRGILNHFGTNVSLWNFLFASSNH
jgi:hypothetical protein